MLMKVAAARCDKTMVARFLLVIFCGMINTQLRIHAAVAVYVFAEGLGHSQCMQAWY
jgi:hypothetical protein